MKEKTETQFYGTQKPFHENQITELRKMRKNFHSLTNIFLIWNQKVMLWLPQCKITSHLNLLLHRAQFHSDNELTLGGNTLQDISLQTSQHVRTKNIMELLDLIFFSYILKFSKESVLVPIEDKQQKKFLQQNKRQ